MGELFQPFRFDRNLAMALDPDRPMYRWRELASEQQRVLLDHGRANRLPGHSPPHFQSDAACSRAPPLATSIST